MPFLATIVKSSHLKWDSTVAYHPSNFEFSHQNYCNYSLSFAVSGQTTSLGSLLTSSSCQLWPSNSKWDYQVVKTYWIFQRWWALLLWLLFFALSFPLSSPLPSRPSQLSTLFHSKVHLTFSMFPFKLIWICQIKISMMTCWRRHFDNRLASPCNWTNKMTYYSSKLTSWKLAHPLSHQTNRSSCQPYANSNQKIETSTNKSMSKLKNLNWYLRTKWRSSRSSKMSKTNNNFSKWKITKIKWRLMRATRRLSWSCQGRHTLRKSSVVIVWMWIKWGSSLRIWVRCMSSCSQNWLTIVMSTNNCWLVKVLPLFELIDIYTHFKCQTMLPVSRKA